MAVTKEAAKPVSAAEKATLSYQADNYLSGLRIERVGYEQRIAIAENDDDAAAKRKYTKRLDQVDAEIERVELGGAVTPTGQPVSVYLGVEDDEPATKTKSTPAPKA